MDVCIQYEFKDGKNASKSKIANIFPQRYEKGTDHDSGSSLIRGIKWRDNCNSLIEWWKLCAEDEICADKFG